MDIYISKYFNILSNIIYFLFGLYLLIFKPLDKHLEQYLFGLGFIIIGIISYIYHLYENNYLLLLDQVIAISCFIYVIITKFDNICMYKYILLLILIFLYILSNICWNINKLNMHNICHGIWHILSAVFVMYLILNNTNKSYLFNTRYTKKYII